MQNLINQSAILDDVWVLLTEVESELPQGKIVVPGQYWQANRAALIDRGDVSIWIQGDAELEDYVSDLDKLPLIAIQFPAFADGRGYSLARLLKERYEFAGEIRAFGDVLLDQLFFMKRCGFDTYALKDGLSAEKALNYFQTFTDPYQMAFDQKEPLFRRKA